MSQHVATPCLFVLLLLQNVICERIFDVACNGDFCIPRVIFGLWNSDYPPRDVQEMINVSKKSFVNFTYCFLSKNVSDFLNFSTFPPQYPKICLACQADYKRVCLLEKYGGLWVDPTTYVNSAGMEVEFLFSEALKAKRSVFGFEKQGIPMKSLIELNFYGANENSVFMKKYKAEYDIALSGNVKSYVKESCRRLRNNRLSKTEKGVFMKECKDKYFMANNVFMTVHYKDRLMKNEVFVFPVARSQYQLANECKFSTNCVHDRLRYDPVARTYPIIKMISWYRNGSLWHIGDSKYDAILAKTSYPGYHGEVDSEMQKVRDELVLYMKKKEEEVDVQRRKMKLQKKNEELEAQKKKKKSNK